MSGIPEVVRQLENEKTRLSSEVEKARRELERLEAELSRVTAALASLSGEPVSSTPKAAQASNTHTRRGRPPGTKLSAEAREKIAAAQRQRWAKAQQGTPN